MPQIDLNVISSEERDALKQFKERIPDVLACLNEYDRHDLSLLRWLRARELDLNKSEDMLRQSMKWRADESMDTIFKWEVPELIYQHFPFVVSGYDNKNSLLAVIPFGRWDIRNIINLGRKFDFIRFVDLLFQQAMQFAKHKSTQDDMITQFVVILDLEGFSFKQITSRETIETIIELLRRFEANHPETLKEAWVVNAPKIFEILYNIVKPIVSARTLSKVHIYGSSVEQWRPLLLANKNPDQLPSNLGGSNTCCKNYKCIYGFDVFPVYEEFDEHDFIFETVGAGVKHVIKIELEKGSKLSWNFRTLDYCIGFSFEYSDPFVTNESSNKVLFQSARADSHVFLQKGAFEADKSGTYSLVFDNSFSRFRTKSLFYCTRVN